MAMALKAEARRYFEQGFNVVAMFFEYAEDGSVARKRAFVEWQKWHTERQTLEEFEAQPWERAEAFGVVCSFPNKDGLFLAVVDYDVKKVSEEAKAKGKELLKQFPITQLEQTVSGGVHYVYLSRVKPSKSNGAFHDSHALELVATGKLCVMAPSKGYKRLNDNTPTVVEDVEGLFYQVLGVEDERLKGKVEEGAPKEKLETWLKQILDSGKLTLRSKGSNFWLFSCPFHPPDNHPSFALNVSKLYFIDYHDNQVYNLKELAEKLGVELEGLKRGVIELGEIQVQPLFNGLSRRLHPAIGVVDDVAYVSVALPCLVQSKQESYEKEMPFLITSDRRKILCHPKVLTQYRWKLEYKVVSFENRWSLKGIQRFLEGETVSPRDVYFGVKEAWQTYLEFPDTRIYKFLTLWCIGTYFFHLFNAYPYIFLQGVKKSGKTKILTVASLLCFNAIFSNNMSTSAIFRLIQSGRCTLLLDEAEKFSTKERAQEIRNLLLSGYKKGAKVYRTEKTGKERLVPESFEVYSPKMLASISGYEDILEDRGFLVVTKRGKDKAIMNREPKDTDAYWQELRDKLYVFYLTNFSEICEVSEEVKLGGKASGREAELAKPILTLAQFFSKYVPEENLVEEMKAFLEQKFEEKETENLTEVGELILVKVLVNNVVKSEGYYKVKDILNAMAEMFDEEPEWLNTKWVGRALKRLGFMDKRRVGTGVEYKLSPEVVKDVAERLGVAEEEKPFPPNYTTSQTTLTPLDSKDELQRNMCDKCGTKLGVKLHMVPGKGEMWLCNECASKLEKPTLTNESFKAVWNALVEASKVRGAAHISEIVRLSGLPSETVQLILKQLEREGRVFQPYAEWWKVA